jgi:murein DD-endopeptidase MepM/ murein hydrolase activator NlpD
VPARFHSTTARHRAARHRANRQRPRVASVAGAALLVVVAVALVMRVEPAAHAGSIPTASAELDAVAADALARPDAPEVAPVSSQSKARAVRPRSSRGTKRTPPRKTRPRKPPWMRPVGGSITSGYGWRWGRMHRGLDFAGSYGGPIYAAADGVISFAGPEGGYGNLIVIDHGGGVQTAYGHMSSILVASGKVRAGQLIARIGSEGYSTGPHLHFEVRINKEQVNPWAFLVARGVRL